VVAKLIGDGALPRRLALDQVPRCPSQLHGSSFRSWFTGTTNAKVSDRQHALESLQGQTRAPGILTSPDVVLDPPACERMLDRIQSNARFAVVGPETGQAARSRDASFACAHGSFSAGTAARKAAPAADEPDRETTKKALTPIFRARRPTNQSGDLTPNCRSQVAGDVPQHVKVATA
jgi:hypothetical protein